MTKIILPFITGFVFFSFIIPTFSQDLSLNSHQELAEEIKSLAQSDVKDNIPRRTDFIVKIYKPNSEGLTSPQVRKIYDEEYTKSKKENKSVFAKPAIIFIFSFILAGIFILKRSTIPKIKKVSVNIPFGIGSVEWEVDPVEQKAAWSLYIELVTRIAIQPLESDQGLLREALSSLYTLFGTTRQILKEAGVVVGTSPRSVGGIAIVVLNKGLRPFLSKWHPALEKWEAERPSTTSRKQHEKNWSEEALLRNELESLQKELEKYAQALAKIAGVKDEK